MVQGASDVGEKPLELSQNLLKTGGPISGGAGLGYKGFGHGDRLAE